MKRFVSAAVLSSLAMFLLSGFFTMVIVKGFITSNVDPGLLRTPPNILLIIIGYFLLGTLMAWIYPRVVHQVSSPIFSGLQFGLASAIFWLMPYSLVLFGAYNFSYLALPLDFGWSLIEQGIGGMIIGLVYGKLTETKKEPSQVRVGGREGLF